MNVPYTAPSFCNSNIKFEDLADSGIRTHWRITAFFLSCFGYIEKLEIGHKIFYLNKESFNKWKNRQVADFKGCRAPHDFITRACFAVHCEQAEKNCRHQSYIRAFASLQMAANRATNPTFKQDVNYLNAWKIKYEQKVDLSTLGAGLVSICKQLEASNFIYEKSLPKIRKLSSVVDEFRSNQVSNQTQSWLAEQGYKEAQDKEMEEFLKTENLNPTLKELATLYYAHFKKAHVAKALTELCEQLKKEIAEELTNYQQYQNLKIDLDTTLAGLDLEKAENILAQINKRFSEDRVKGIAPKKEVVTNFKAFLATNDFARLPENTHYQKIDQIFTVGERAANSAGNEVDYRTQLYYWKKEINSIKNLYANLKETTFEAAMRNNYFILPLDPLLTRHITAPKTPEGMAAEKCAKRYALNFVAQQAERLFKLHQKVIDSIKLEDEADQAINANNLTLAYETLTKSLACIQNLNTDARQNVLNKQDTVKQLLDWDNKLADKEGLVIEFDGTLENAKISLEASKKELSEGAYASLSQKLSTLDKAKLPQDRIVLEYISLHKNCEYNPKLKSAYMRLAYFEGLAQATNVVKEFNQQLAACKKVFSVEQEALKLLSAGQVKECREILPTIETPIQAEKDRLQACQRDISKLEEIMAMKLPSMESLTTSLRASLIPCEAALKEHSAHVRLKPLKDSLVVAIRYLDSQNLNAQQLEDWAKQLHAGLTNFPNYDVRKEANSLPQDFVWLKSLPLPLVERYGVPYFGVRMLSCIAPLPACLPQYVTEQLEIDRTEKLEQEVFKKKKAEIEQLEKELFSKYSSDLFTKWNNLLNCYYVKYLIDNDKLNKAISKLHEKLFEEINDFKTKKESRDDSMDLLFEILALISHNSEPKPILRWGAQELHLDPVRFKKFSNSVYAIKFKMIELNRKNDNYNDFDMLKVKIQAYKDFLELYNMLIACLILIRVTPRENLNQVAEQIAGERYKIADALVKTFSFQERQAESLLTMIQEMFPAIKQLVKIVEKVRVLLYA